MRGFSVLGITLFVVNFAQIDNTVPVSRCPGLLVRMPMAKEAHPPFAHSSHQLYLPLSPQTHDPAQQNQGHRLNDAPKSGAMHQRPGNRSRAHQAAFHMTEVRMLNRFSTESRRFGHPEEKANL